MIKPKLPPGATRLECKTMSNFPFSGVLHYAFQTQTLPSSHLSQALDPTVAASVPLADPWGSSPLSPCLALDQVRKGLQKNFPRSTGMALGSPYKGPMMKQSTSKPRRRVDAPFPTAPFRICRRFKTSGRRGAIHLPTQDLQVAWSGQPPHDQASSSLIGA